jgi:RNA polymerase primary sigma factor
MQRSAKGAKRPTVSRSGVDPRVLERRDVKRLVQKAETQGYVTAEEVFAVVSTEAVEELDDLVGELQHRNVALVDTAESGSRLKTDRRSEDDVDTGASADALSSYLREIHQLPSLDRETEIEYARDFHSGMRTAMGAIVEAQLFVDEVLVATSRIRRDRKNVWDIIDRMRYVEEEEEVAKAKEALFSVVDLLAPVRLEERRLLAKISRRGVKQDTRRSVALRLRELRAKITDLLLHIPMDPRFTRQVAEQMIDLHARLEEARRERDCICRALGVVASGCEEKIRQLRRDGGDEATQQVTNDADRLFKRNQRKIRRLEDEVGMEFGMLCRVVLSYRSGILRAQRARDALILSAQKLVLSSARYYGRRLGGSGMEVADLISAGNLGLIRAVELFDPERGYRFSTFAGHWVRHAMVRTIHTQSRTVYVPPHIRQQMSKILAMENDLIQKQGRPPTDEELAQASQIDLPKLRHTVQSLGRMSSIDRPIDPEDSGSATFGDILADDSLTPDQELEGAERRNLIRQLADRLVGREKTIIFMRMGWDNYDVRTLAEIGDHFKISRQRVEQLEKRALSKLRRWAKASGLSDPFRDH